MKKSLILSLLLTFYMTSGVQAWNTRLLIDKDLAEDLGTKIVNFNIGFVGIIPPQPKIVNSLELNKNWPDWVKEIPFDYDAGGLCPAKYILTITKPASPPEVEAVITLDFSDKVILHCRNKEVHLTKSEPSDALVKANNNGYTLYIK